MKSIKLAFSCCFWYDSFAIRFCKAEMHAEFTGNKRHGLVSKIEKRYNYFSQNGLWIATNRSSRISGVLKNSVIVPSQHISSSKWFWNLRYFCLAQTRC